MRLLGWLALAAMVGGAVSADARMHAPYRGHRIAPSTAAPLDAFATPGGAYSLRRLKSSYSGPGVKLRRASDNAVQDIGFLGFTGFSGAPLDVAAANGFCAATSCFVDTWYDQSGTGGRNAIRAAGQQPTIVFSCAPNGSMCIRATPAGQLLGTDVPHVAPVMPTTFGVVANRSLGTGACVFPEQFTANNSITGGTANQWVLTGGSGGTIAAAAADTAWHTAVGVLAGAASLLRIDATEVTGTATGSTVADAFIPIWSGTASNCDVVEIIVWSGYALSPSERSALTANQKAYWGF